jgi:hypothetical protein
MIPDVACVTDALGNIQACNAAFCELLGGCVANILAVMHTEDQKLFYDKLKAVCGSDDYSTTRLGRCRATVHANSELEEAEVLDFTLSRDPVRDVVLVIMRYNFSAQTALSCIS